jgi:hypothetical protein
MTGLLFLSILLLVMGALLIRRGFRKTPSDSAMLMAWSMAAATLLVGGAICLAFYLAYSNGG